MDVRKSSVWCMAFKLGIHVRASLLMCVCVMMPQTPTQTTLFVSLLILCPRMETVMCPLKRPKLELVATWIEGILVLMMIITTMTRAHTHVDNTILIISHTRNYPL